MAEIAGILCAAFAIALIITGVRIIRHINRARHINGLPMVAEQRFRRYATAERMKREIDNGPWQKP